MRLLGVETVDQLGPQHVCFPHCALRPYEVKY
jgi:hypothetical protein